LRLNSKINKSNLIEYKKQKEMKLFLCFILSKDLEKGVSYGTEYFFKNEKILSFSLGKRRSYIIVKTKEGYPLPDKEVLVPGVVTKLVGFRFSIIHS
jgi:hypothetical protein